MPVTNYYTANGQIIAEATSGVRTDYLMDALGSVTATVNQSGAIVNTYRHKPYGGLLAKTGVGSDPSFLWVGSQGYRQTSKKYNEVYIRARHYSSTVGRWNTKDPLGLAGGDINLYRYVRNWIATLADPSGKLPKPPREGKCNCGCGDDKSGDKSCTCPWNYCRMEEVLWEGCKERVKGIGGKPGNTGGNNLPAIRDALAKYCKNCSKIDERLIRCQIFAESTGNPNKKTGGAYGMMQITRETWNQCCKAEFGDYDQNKANPDINIRCGIKILCQCKNCKPCGDPDPKKAGFGTDCSRDQAFCCCLTFWEPEEWWGRGWQ